ncbi:MAG: prephenate dehydratase [Candidatus Gastranaerophilales bacterium]|nr:prephenate dehydratase [Candidatus Gastranaerophilales bacterium]
MSNDKKIFFLGPKTSYTDVAKEKLKKQFCLEGYKDTECRTITAVASELSNLENEDSLAVLPIENSIEGIVKEAIDNISRIDDKDIKILGECVIPINHCLITYANSLSDVKTIVSHPQAISQCFDYIYKVFNDNVVYKSESSTANSVKNISEEDKTVAAIGSKYSAEFYNKPVVAKNINDEKFNQTRFLLVGKKQMPKFDGEYKTSITFSTENKSGALCEILLILQKYNINMSYISSRPSKKVLGEYTFYIDFDGKITDEKVSKAVFEILQHVRTFKHLGSYPKAVEI